MSGPDDTLRPRLSTRKTGIIRYVLHKDLVRYLADGWIYAADLGPYTGQYSTLMWWCSGDCKDGESPRYPSDRK